MKPVKEKKQRMNARKLTEILGDALIPKKYRKSIHDYFERASIADVPYFRFGVAAYLIVLLSVVAALYVLSLPLFSNAGPLKIVLGLVIIPVFFVALTFIAVLLTKVLLDAKIYRKTRIMEEDFPDFLSEVSLNLKAGLDIVDAIDNSTEKQFRYLSEEMNRIVQKVRLGVDIDEAITEFTQNFQSDIMEETFNLMMVSWKRGARTPHLLDRVYDNIETIRFLKNKVIASVTSYRLFLGTITLVIAPAMFALAFYLIDLMRNVTTRIIQSTGNTALPFAVNVVRINDQHFVTFSIIALVITAVSTALIMSVIKTGSVKESYKAMVIFGAISYASYQVFLIIFEKFFALFAI